MDEKNKVAPAHASGPYDTELDVRAIVGFGAGLFVVTLVVLAIMWWMSTFFKAEEEAEDRPPSPIAEQQLDPIPPGPRLQAVPPRDMDELRAQDKEALRSYGWVDRSAGVARIPVERAIAILAEKGLPKVVAPPVPDEPAPSPAASSRAPPASSQVTAPAAKPPRPKKGPK